MVKDNGLVDLSKIRRDIAETHDVLDLKLIDKKLAAMKEAFQRAGRAQSEIVAVRIDCGVKIGVLLGPALKPTDAKPGAGRPKKSVNKRHRLSDVDKQADRKYRAMALVPELDPKWDEQFRADLLAKDSKHTPTEYIGKGLKLNRRQPEEPETDEDGEVIENPNVYYLTGAQKVEPCDALITDPPYGILDEDWEPKHLREFTSDWASSWNECDAHYVAVFFSQRWMWDARKWFDRAFSHYNFQQLLVWVYQNNKGHQDRKGFKQTWEPVFLYRHKNTDRKVLETQGDWGKGLNDLDTHIAAVPQSNFVAANEKRHPAQKPVAVMRWLVNAISAPGELVADPFCGSGTTGVAALQLGRNFHGVETDKGYRELADERIQSYGHPTV